MSKKNKKQARVKIYLDDIRKPPAGYIGIATPEECIEWLQLCKKKGTIVEILSLDHDLGLYNPSTLEERTGYDVLLWLEQNIDHMPEKIVIHSANPVGRNRMELALSSINRRIESV